MKSDLTEQIVVDGFQPGYCHLYMPSGRILVPSSQQMLIGHEILKCVAFVAWRKGGDYHIGGTVFFVLQIIEGTSRGMLYGVTARHVIEHASQRSDDAKIYLRLNEKNSTCSWLPTARSDWEFHDDGKVDVAAIALRWDDETFNRFDHLTIPARTMLMDEHIQILEISPGDELFFPGLFVRHIGSERNLPILRTGIIAGLPSEPVPTSLGNTKAYLAELRSIGGHSGSPVFVHFGLERLRLMSHLKRDASGPVRELLNETPGIDRSPLLGLVHGHFPLRPDQHSAITSSTELDGASKEDLNSGIAVITPASAIRDILNQRRFVRERSEIADKVVRDGGTTVAD